MRRLLLVGIILSFLMLTTVSAYMPPGAYYEIPDDFLNLEPDFNPGMYDWDGMFIGACECQAGDIGGGCSNIDGCAAHKVCDTGLCMLNSDCGGPGCGLDLFNCETACDNAFDDCKLDCGMSIFCGKTCLGKKNTCYAACNDTYDDCNECNGLWSSCQKVNLCCNVQCADAAYACNPDNGECECKHEEELCAADGTGNGIDEDCDGDIDETCGACAEDELVACTKDACPGTRTCQEDNTWGDCVKNNPCCKVDCEPNEMCNPSNGECDCKMTTEICGNAFDDDCDGEKDEGCAGAPPSGSEDDSNPANPLWNSSGSTYEQDVAERKEACITKGGRCVEQCVGCAPEYLEVCEDGEVIEGICAPPKPGVIGGTREVCCISKELAGGQKPQNASSVFGTDQNMASDFVKALDINLLIIFAIIIIVLVGVLIGVKMLKGKKEPPTTVEQVIQLPPAQESPKQ